MGIALLSALVGACAQAGVTPYAANAELCQPPTPVQRQWLQADDWKPFEPFVRVCTVLDNKGAAALLVVSVWADLYYADKPAGSTTVQMPKPLLLLPNGRKVGELPSNFPSDPPAELVIRFTQWTHDLPSTIELSLATPTASGDQTLAPLKYNPAQQRYEQTAQ